MPAPASTPWTTDRRWSWLIVTLPALTLYAGHRLDDLFGLISYGEPSWPAQMGVGATVGIGLARLARSGGVAVAAAVLLAGQLLGPSSSGAEASLVAFTAAVLQVALVILVLDALRDDEGRGASAAWSSWTPARAGLEALTYALPIVVCLLAWWSGLAAWLWSVLEPRSDRSPADALTTLVALPVAGYASLLVPALGRAVVARRRLRSRVATRIGWREPPLTVTADGLETRVLLLDFIPEEGEAETGTGVQGAVDDILAITLAASATALAATAVALAATAVMDGHPGLPHALVSWFAAFESLFFVSLLPCRMRWTRTGPLIASEGRQILDALAVKWALR